MQAGLPGGQGLGDRGGGTSGYANQVRLLVLAAPAAPINLTLGIATRPPALRAHWAAPPGRRDGFQLCLYRRRPLILQSQDTVAPEAQTFSWPLLFPGTEFLVQLTTLRGPDASNSINATGWMRECPPHCLPHSQGGGCGSWGLVEPGL